jgi:ribosomal protein S27AE
MPKTASSKPASTAAGSSIAALWLQISQDNHPPTSVPVKHTPQNCPQCHQPLNMLLEAFERQSCLKCGWSEQLRSSNAHDTGALAELELQQLLEKAALESLGNMKPRRQKDAP